MNKFHSLIASPTALLYMYLTVVQIVSGFYLADSIEPPRPFALLYALGFLWVIGWWLLKDSRKRGVEWVLDMGLFLYIAWPLIMPYYLLKTRGVRGFFVILVFIGVYLTAAIVGVVLYALLVS
jgi:hypothetical protein